MSQDPQATELVRRIENLVRLATVAELDADAARVRAAIAAIDEGEGLTTDWIPWHALRAAGVRIWSAPTVGEQCILLAPGGDLAQAVALPGIYSDSNAPAEASEGTFVVDAPASGGITLRCGASSIVMTDAGIKIAAPRIDWN